MLQNLFLLRISGFQLTGWVSSVWKKDKTTTWLIVFLHHLKTHTEAYSNAEKTYSHLVLFVNFDGFIGLCGDQSALWVIEHTGKDSGLAVQRPRLHSGVNPLEVVACPPVPHVHGSIVGWREINRTRTKNELNVHLITWTISPKNKTKK